MSKACALSMKNFVARSTKMAGCRQSLCFLAALLFVCGCLGSSAFAAQNLFVQSITDQTNNCPVYPVNSLKPCSVGPGDTIVIAAQNGVHFGTQGGNVGTCDCPIASSVWGDTRITSTVNFVASGSANIQVEDIGGNTSPPYPYNPLGPQITSIQVGGCTSSSTQTCHIAVGQPVTINGKYFGTTTVGTSGLQVAMCDCANATINTWTNTQITVTATQVLPNSDVSVGLVGLMGWSNGISYSPGALEILVPPGAVSDTNYTGNLTAMQQDPSVTGATITVYWSDFDCENKGCTNAGGTSGGDWDWHITDAAFASWKASGKKVNVVLQMISNAAPQGNTCPASGIGSRGASNVGNCAMPPWVWNMLTSANYSTCDTTGAPNPPQQFPNYFNPGFMTAYQNAVAAFINNYGPQFPGGYVRVALGHGGEILPDPKWATDCLGVLEGRNWSNTGNSSDFVTAWIDNWLTRMADFMGGNNFNGGPTPMQIMGAITPMGTSSNANEVPDDIAPIYVQNRMGFGSQGLEASDVGSNTGTADWIKLFSENPGVPLELQTLGQSCPGAIPSGQNPPCGSGSIQCTINGTNYTMQSLASCTGDLPTLLHFASSTNASIFEVYYQDWDLAHITTPMPNGYCTTPGGPGNGTQYCNGGNNPYGTLTLNGIDNNF